MRCCHRFVRDDGIDVSQACQYYDRLFMAGNLTLTQDYESQEDYPFVVANGNGNSEVFF